MLVWERVKPLLCSTELPIFVEYTANNSNVQIIVFALEVVKKNIVGKAAFFSPFPTMF